jgi:DNA transposition AAA+ family ATPase
LCERLRKSPCLLIFDQAERVSIRIFDLIRQIWDRTHDAGVGVVLLSAPILLTRMNQSRVADLGALTSRVGIWAPLAGVGRAEMAAIVKREGFTDIEESAFDLWWRATGGSMRRLMRALDLLKAKHANKRITEKTISGIACHLWGMSIEGEL